MSLPILILAAGQSSRMRGADKLAQTVDGVPLVRLQALRALALNDAREVRVFVALPANPEARGGLLHDLDVTLWPTPSAAEGMGSTLRDSVARLPDCDRFMVLLADLAALETDDLTAVAAAMDAHPDAMIWRGATQGGQPGHPIIFDARLRPQFAALTGDTGGESIVRDHHTRTHLVPLPGTRARLDLDTPEDWAAFRAETGR